ncbi:MAG: hypothetical protein ACOY7J_02125 [Pseudomonadota bacterium]
MTQIYEHYLVWSSSNTALAFNSEFKVLSISPQDNRAVIQTAEGKMQVLSPGDKLDDATVMQVLTDKLVLRSAQGEMVWLFKSKDQQPSEMKTFSTSWPKEEWPKQMTTQ